MTFAEQQNNIIEVKDEFDPTPVRRLLGLDGNRPIKLSRASKEMLATRLWEAGFLTLEEVAQLGMMVRQVPEYEKGECSIHGKGAYFKKGFKCALRDHEESGLLIEADVFRDKPLDR